MKKPKEIYTCRYLDIFVDNKKIVLSVHAIKRARQREITPDIIEKTLRNGKINRFGKNSLRISSRSINCVGETIGDIILIKTITLR